MAGDDYSQLLAENEQGLLRDWVEAQKRSDALRSGQIRGAELTENSRRLLTSPQHRRGRFVSASSRMPTPRGG
jgi:hypothetical protein